jgi:cardiolipin synthase
MEKQAWSSLGPDNQGVSLIGAGEINDYLISMLKSAKSSIELQTFKMYEKDWVDLIIKKAKEGIKIHIQISDVAHINYSAKTAAEALFLIKQMQEAGVQVDQFNPQLLQRKTSVYSPDMHKKVVVVDNKYAYVGNKNFNGHSDSIEFGIGLKGSSVTDIRSFFYKDFANSTKEVKYLDEILNIGQHSKINFYNSQGLKIKLLKSISEARKSITLAQIEFNDPDVLRALIASKKKTPDLDIKIITMKAAKSYSVGKIKFTRTFNIEAIEELSQNGIGVHAVEFDQVSERFFHGKMMVLDGERVILGSSDYNVRSLNGNAEFDLELASPIISSEFENYLKSIVANKPTKFAFTQSERLLSIYFELITDMLFKLNAVKVKTIDKFDINSETFKLIIRRQMGTIAQQIIALRQKYSITIVKNLDQIYKSYKTRIISNEIFNDSPLEDDEFYLFVGSSSFGSEKIKKDGMDPTLNGHFGNGFYLATNIETAMNYAGIRNKQIGKNLDAVDILVFRFKGPFNQKILTKGNSENNSDALLIEAVEGLGRDYLLLQRRDQFELARHLKISLK